MPEPPNIVFILSDQLRFDALGCYGHPTAITPNIDRLAGEGVRFENCYSTNAFCLPSRASIVTGRYCHQHHVHTNKDVLGRDEVCFPARLRDAGYLTACIGKLHLWEQWSPGRSRADHGFEVMQIVEGKHSFSTRVEESRVYFDFLADVGKPQPRRWGREPNCRHTMMSWTSQYDASHHVDGFLTTRAERVIEEAGRAPLMLWLGLCSPHDPFDPPAEYLARYEGLEIPEPVFDPAATATKSPEFRQFQRRITKRYNLPSEEWSDDETRRRVEFMRRHYLATVTLVDDCVGRVISALERRGMLDETIIVLVSDHGDFLGDHGCVNKGMFFYEPNVHVPLIVRGGPAAGGRAVRGLVQTTDLFRTILELACVDTSDAPPSSRSLVAAMRDPTSAVRGAVMAESGHRRMVRAGDWKLIFENDPAGLELYNLAEDPMEQHNLARDDADPERLTSEAGRWERVAGLLGEFAHLTAGCEPRAE